MAVSTVPSGTNVLSTHPSVGNFQQFSGPISGDEYLEGQNFFAQVGKIAQINANVEPDALLKGLDFHTEITKASKPASRSWCSRGIIGGLAASLFTKSPFPFLMGISECFTRTYAQQRVGSEFQINTYVSDSQANPSVASLNNGDFIVTWWSDLQDGSDYGIYGQLLNNFGNKIGSEFRVNTHTTDRQQLASVASFSNGNFVVTWMSNLQDGSDYGIYGQLFNNIGNKIGNEFQVNTFSNNSQEDPSVAILNNGNFVVTWQSAEQDGSGWGVYSQLFDGNSSKIGSEFQVNTYTTSGQSEPSVASLNNGNFVVTWQSWWQDSSDYGTYGQLFDGNSSKIGNEFQVNTFTNNSQVEPSVASLNNGNFVATWMSDDQDGDGWGIFGQLFTENATKIGNEFQANTFINNTQGQPSVASFKDSNFVVIWRSLGQDGSGWGVYSQWFDGNSSKIGSEFRVNTRTFDAQEDPSVAGLSNGNFVATWHSWGQDGSSFGVYGQIFHDNNSTSSSTSTTNSLTSTTPVTSNIDPSRTTSRSSNPPLLSLDISERSREVISPPIDPNNRLLWLWVLLGIVGGTTCIGLTGYVLLRRKKKEGDRSSLELGEPKPPSESKIIKGDPSSSREGYANAPRDAAGNIGYANIPEDAALGKDYANRPKDADLKFGYAHLPQ